MSEARPSGSGRGAAVDGRTRRGRAGPDRSGRGTPVVLASDPEHASLFAWELLRNRALAYRHLTVLLCPGPRLTRTLLIKLAAEPEPFAGASFELRTVASHQPTADERRLSELLAAGGAAGRAPAPDGPVRGYAGAGKLALAVLEIPVPASSDGRPATRGPACFEADELIVLAIDASIGALADWQAARLATGLGQAARQRVTLVAVDAGGQRANAQHA